LIRLFFGGDLVFSLAKSVALLAFAVVQAALRRRGVSGTRGLAGFIVPLTLAVIAAVNMPSPTAKTHRELDAAIAAGLFETD